MGLSEKRGSKERLTVCSGESFKGDSCGIVEQLLQRPTNHGLRLVPAHRLGEGGREERGRGKEREREGGRAREREGEGEGGRAREGGREGKEREVCAVMCDV